MPPSATSGDKLHSEAGGYKGRAYDVLESYGARSGNSVKITTDDGLETTGLIVPRYEHADSEHVVLKLKSGYNIGILVDKIKSIAVLEDVGERKFGVGPYKSHEGENTLSSKNLLLLSTGGTIASRVDYRTGAVHPALSAEDLYSAVPELGEIASVHPNVVFSTYSENLTPSDWQKLSEEILVLTDSLQKRPDGVVVMLGTDTLAYVAAALSFSLLGFDLPVVCVGAQRSSDRPSSDAALNLKAAASFAVCSKLPGVYVSMHDSENDNIIAVHSGVRVRKNHTSRRDAFESIDSKHIAHVKDAESFEMAPQSNRELDQSLKLKTKFEPAVALVKFHPGFDQSILDYYVDERKVKGIVIEGTGLGHVSSSTVSNLSEIVKRRIFVGMTSQCIWGHVDLNVYETGRDLLAAGVMPLENMLAETAFAKLSWALGNFPAGVNEVMLENLVGEFTQRIPLKMS
ncbi:MAG: Glu-tRNA(Gln) amidotransferase subunit GatD [Nitrososphaerales archaeon]